MQEKLSLVNVADSAIWQEWLAGGKLGQDGQTGVPSGAQHRPQAQYSGKRNLGITLA